MFRVGVWVRIHFIYMKFQFQCVLELLNVVINDRVGLQPRVHIGRYLVAIKRIFECNSFYTLDTV